MNDFKYIELLEKANISLKDIPVKSRTINVCSTALRLSLVSIAAELSVMLGEREERAYYKRRFMSVFKYVPKGLKEELKCKKYGNGQW